MKTKTPEYPFSHFSTDHPDIKITNVELVEPSEPKDDSIRERLRSEGGYFIEISFPESTEKE